MLNIECKFEVLFLSLDLVKVLTNNRRWKEYLSCNVICWLEFLNCWCIHSIPYNTPVLGSMGTYDHLQQLDQTGQLVNHSPDNLSVIASLYYHPASSYFFPTYMSLFEWLVHTYTLRKLCSSSELYLASVWYHCRQHTRSSLVILLTSLMSSLLMMTSMCCLQVETTRGEQLHVRW